MNVSQPFRSSHNIGGVECDFPSKKELLEYLNRVVSPPASFVHIVTLNAEMVVQAQHNEQFKNIINKAEIVIPDGSSILWAREYLQRAGRASSTLSLIKFFFSKHQPMTGVDTIFDICEIIEQKNGTIYLVGGKPEEAQKTAQILRKKYPGLRVDITPSSPACPAGRSPFVRGRERTLPLLTKEGIGEVSAIFVALGSPKQSLWIEHNREALMQEGITIAMGVGGAFAMISGALPRAPRWMRRHHIEWLWRLMLEPKRMNRIWNAVVVFPKLMYKNGR